MPLSHPCFSPSALGTFRTIRRGGGEGGEPKAQRIEKGGIEKLNNGLLEAGSPVLTTIKPKARLSGNVGVRGNVGGAGCGIIYMNHFFYI